MLEEDRVEVFVTVELGLGQVNSIGFGTPPEAEGTLCA